MPVKQVKKQMSREHKEALAQGREEGRIVRRYLDALEIVNAPKRRGRRRTQESVLARLDQVRAGLADPNTPVLDRLHLTQEEIDLVAEADGFNDVEIDLIELEEDFVEVAASYGQRKGITVKAWRFVGVPRAVLKRAGIS